MTLSDTALVDLTTVKAYLRADAAASLHINAEFVGVGTGAEDEFTLDNTPVEGTLALYVNNVLQVETTDFAIVGAAITFVTDISLNYGITADYDCAAGDDTFESYDDLLLESLIAGATKEAEDYTGSVFIQRSIVETRIGNGGEVMKLYKMPIASVTTITIDETDLETWSERLSIGRIYSTAGWTEDAEIIVTYVAGYGATRAATQALIPDAVIAVLRMVAYLYNNRIDGVQAENVAGIGSVTYNILEQSGAKQYLEALVVGARGLG